MEWISVNYSMPEPDTDVLVWVSEDYNCHDIGRHSGKKDDTFCDGWDTNNDLTKYRTITHWMPLPPKP